MNFTVEELKQLPLLTFKDYQEMVAPIANGIFIRTGILAIVPIIQSAHESRDGNSGLARGHCNLFGIVATESWKKRNMPVAAMPTWEEIEGKRVDMTREFRAYHSWQESFEDWAGIITGLSIYKKAYQLMKDSATVADGIIEMGKIYATDSKYARKLLDIYEQVKNQ